LIKEATQQQTISKISSQVDIVPTLLGLLNIQHINSTLGINLFNEDREFVVLDVEDRYAVLNDEFLLIVEKNGDQAIYKYKNKDKTNYIHEQKILAERMNLFAKSYFQSFDYITRNNNKISIAK
jgi:phosphoglycerol transferase MdoB-like AlkP superfamily enzyme